MFSKEKGSKPLTTVKWLDYKANIDIVDYFLVCVRAMPHYMTPMTHGYVAPIVNLYHFGSELALVVKFKLK